MGRAGVGWRDGEKMQIIVTEQIKQNKTLVIRKLTELVEFDFKLDEKTKAMLRETKENVQGTNSDGKETGICNFSFLSCLQGGWKGY